MDAFGNAALDFLNDNNDEFIYVESKTMEDDVIPVKHLFRSLDQMPYCEQKAIEIAKGKVLDVGGGVGSHCLVLQEKGLDTTMLDFSPGLCEASTKRGVKNVIEADFFKWKTDQKFDTLLFMMNGIGIGGSFELFQKRLRNIEENIDLLNEFKLNGIMPFAYHVNLDTGFDEEYVTKYEMVREMVGTLLQTGEIVDDKLGVMALNSLPIAFKISYNTLIHYDILNEIEDNE